MLVNPIDGKSNSGLFISIDGVDGCGKTSQVKALKHFFELQGCEVFLTKEPGGTVAGGYLRNILLSPDYDIEPETELLLYCADRAEHQSKVVIPQTEKGVTVISDRFVMSTYAYQIFGRKLNKKLLDFVTAETVKRFPDLNIIIDMDVDTAIERARKRLEHENLAQKEGKFEKLSRNFFNDVRQGFLWCAENFPNTFVVNGDCGFEEVHGKIKELAINLKKKV